MKNMIRDKWGRNAHWHILRELLGLSRLGHLPDEGLPEQLIQGHRVYVKPVNTVPGRRVHRVTVICSCGQHYSAGRMHQHKCKTSFNPAKPDDGPEWARPTKIK